jgi:hypothetical protein
LTLALSYILRKAIEHRPIRYVIKDLYVNSPSDEVSSVFRHLFSLDRSSPVTWVRDLDYKCDVVVISSRPLLSFKLSQTGFSGEDLLLFNLRILCDDSIEAKAHARNIERHLLRPRSPDTLRKEWDKSAKLVSAGKQGYLSNRLFNSIEFGSLPNVKQKTSPAPEMSVNLSLFQSAKESSPRDPLKMPFPSAMNIQASSWYGKGSRPERINSKNFLDESNQLVQLRSSHKFPILTHNLPSKAGSKSPGLPKPDRRFSPSLTLLTSSGGSTARARTFLSRGQIARARAVCKVQERVIGQIGSIEAYCLRYSLTSDEFTKQLEEFAVLALESSKGGVGIQPELLSNLHNTNIYALRGLNPHLLDLSSVDKLDVRQVITPSMLLTWQEFTLYCSLAVSQRACKQDILQYLFTLARITHLSQVSKESCMEALRSKFILPHKFTAKLQLSWRRVTRAVLDGLTSGEARESSLTLEELVEIGSGADVTLAELRCLAGEVFVSHRKTVITERP